MSSGSNMEELKDRKGYLKASNADGLVILEAVTTWCSQCKAIAPFVETMQTKYPESRWFSYNTDTADDIAQELGARVMPTFHIFKDGDLRGSVTGAKAKELEEAIVANYDGNIME